MGKKGGQTKISSRTLTIIVTIVIVAVAFSSVTYIGLDKKTQDVVGPKIKVTNEIQPFSDKNLTNATETIQIFFPVLIQCNLILPPVLI
jgi:predicted RND superfamily exporter protein